MKKLCFFTSARSEYGLLKWLMKDTKDSKHFVLQLIVSGAHLLKEQGYTIDSIKKDGFKIDAIIDINLDTTTQEGIAASMGRLAERLAPALSSLNPDYLIVLGDRYELLPICSVAYVMNIPIVHLSGGDVTKGAIDDGIRNAVTMLASYHFPGTKESAENIIRMRGANNNIWCVGEPGLDQIHREKLLTRDELAKILGIDTDKKWVMLTYHAETNQSIEYNMNAIQTCCDVLYEYPDLQIVATYSNADYGGTMINNYIIKTSENRKNFRAVPSLGNLKYLSFLKQASFIIGNSSSGIIEAPALKCPVVNIGNRQEGRYQCGNIIQTDILYKSVKSAVDQALNGIIDISDADHWGDGHTSERILEILEHIFK